MSNIQSLGAMIAARPSANDAAHFYGGPYRYTEGKGGWVNPDPKWLANNLVKIPIARLPGFPKLYGNQTVSGVTLHRKVAPVFEMTWAEIYRRGLHTRLRSYDGAFAARHMLNNPRNPLSRHALGAAVDFDAQWNGYGLDPRRMQIDAEVVRVFESYGWAWGGRWKPTDGMHFEWIDPLVARPAHQDSAARGTLPQATPVVIAKPAAKPAPGPVPMPELAGTTLWLPEGGEWKEAGVIDAASRVGNKTYIRTKAKK